MRVTRRGVILTSMGVALLRTFLIVSFVAASPSATTNLKMRVTPIGCSIDSTNAGGGISIHLTPAECADEFPPEEEEEQGGGTENGGNNGGSTPEIIETVIDTGTEQPLKDYYVVRDPEPMINQAETLGEGRIAVGADQIYRELAQTLAVKPEQLKEATATAFGVGVVVVFVVAIVVMMTL